MLKARALVLLAGLVVLAASPASAVVDTGTSQFVAAGRNTGEFQGWKEVYFHGATGAIGWGFTRTHDANGISITSELGNNNQSFSSSGTVTPCPQHATSSLRFSSLAELGVSSIDFEKQLLKYGVLPGRYLLSITKGADTLSVSREFNSDPDTYSVTATFMSSGNVPAAGVSINIIQPYTTAWGTTDSNGRVTGNLAPGWYRIELNNNVTWRTYSNYLMYIGDSPGQPNIAKTFVATPIGDPAATATGGMRIQVNDSTTNAALFNARVQVGGAYFYTGVDGSAWVTGMAGGTYTVSASKAGYNAQTTTKTVSTGSVATVTFNLDPSGDPGPGGGGEPGDDFDLSDLLNPDFWTGILQAAFVPSEATIDAWEAAINEVKAWGPFGVIAAIKDDFDNPGTVAGESQLVWEMDADFSGGATAAWRSYIDLRPALAEEDAAYGVYPTSRGSIFGTFLFALRPLWVALVWFLWGFALVKWVRPRFTV